jgi:hypothetical protein
MANFVETIRLKGLAEEDVYFARRDRELIAALRKKKGPVRDQGSEGGATPDAPAQDPGGRKGSA